MIKKDKFQILMEEGYKNYQYGKYKEAQILFERARDEAIIIKDTDKQCVSIKMIATALFRLAKYPESEKKYNVALELAIKIKNILEECKIYNHLIGLYEMIDEYVKAKNCIEKGYKIAFNLNDKQLIAKFSISMGVYQHLFGDDEQALKFYEQGKQLFEDLNDNRGIGTSMNMLGGYYYGKGNFEKALEYYQKARNLGMQLQDFEIIALATCRTSLTFHKMKDNEKALNFLMDPFTLEEIIENKKIIIEVYQVRGLIYKMLSENDKAKEYFLKAEKLAKELNNKYLLAKIEKELGIFFAELGDVKSSYSYLKISIELFNEIQKKIQDENLNKIFQESFKDITELIWIFSKIFDKVIKETEYKDINEINDAIISLCKINNNNAPDYALKLQTRILTRNFFAITKESKLKQNKTEVENILLKERISELEKQRDELNAEIDRLKLSLNDIEDKYHNLKLNSENFDALTEDSIKYFVNTKVWEDKQIQIRNREFKEFYDCLSDKSKEEAVLMRLLLDLLNSGYELCVFLLARIIERELRSKIFETFKNYWKEDLNEMEFCIEDNCNFYTHSPTIEKKINKIYQTNEIFLDYLNNNAHMELGKMNHILKEIEQYCRIKQKKLLYLGWESYFINLFSYKICKITTKIINSFKIEIQSTKDSINFIDLRNMVMHADDVESQSYKSKTIDFNSGFIEFLLKFLTIEEPKLLNVISQIKPEKKR